MRWTRPDFMDITFLIILTSVIVIILLTINETL